MENNFVLIADFGGQYNQLIARRVRELSIYSEVVPWNKIYQEALAKKPQAIIFTGGPASVYEQNAPKVEKELFELNIPVLGICYGLQLIAQTLGGKVVSPDFKEYGKVELIKKEDTKPSRAPICHMVMPLMPKPANAANMGLPIISPINQPKKTPYKTRATIATKMKNT